MQPLVAHEHWHVDMSYINVAGTFYYLTSILDGYSRAIVHAEVRESMTERDVETVVQRAREKYPRAPAPAGRHPRIISDNGPQFIAREFKEFIRIAGMTHVRTSPYYPQSNGKLERWHASLKCECIRPAAPQSADEARRRVAAYVEHYNNVRLHVRHRLRYAARQVGRTGTRHLGSPRCQACRRARKEGRCSPRRAKHCLTRKRALRWT